MKTGWLTFSATLCSFAELGFVLVFVLVFCGGCFYWVLFVWWFSFFRDFFLGGTKRNEVYIWGWKNGRKLKPAQAKTKPCQVLRHCCQVSTEPVANTMLIGVQMFPRIIFSCLKIFSRQKESSWFSAQLD